MNIIFLIPDLSLGGSQLSAIKFLNVISRNQTLKSVQVFTHTDTHTLAKKLNDNVHVYNLNLKINFFKAFATLNKAVKESRKCIIFGWSMNSYALANLLGIVNPKSKVIISERYAIKDFFSFKVNSIFRVFWHFFVIKFLCLRSDVVTANSRQNLEILKASIKKNVISFYLPNVLDLDTLATSDESAKKIIGMQSKGHLTFFSMGRLVEQKGFDVLIKAVSLLKDKGLSLQCIIAGDGPLRSQLRFLARDLGVNEEISFVGELKFPGDWYRRADVVVVPSRAEGFPNVVLEAMACGKTVISSDCETGPREMIRDGKNGFLTPVNDHVALSRIMAKIIANEECLIQFGVEARKDIISNYGKDKVHDQYNRLLSLIRF